MVASVAALMPSWVLPTLSVFALCCSVALLMLFCRASAFSLALWVSCWAPSLVCSVAELIASWVFCAASPVASLAFSMPLLTLSCTLLPDAAPGAWLVSGAGAGVTSGAGVTGAGVTGAGVTGAGAGAGALLLGAGAGVGAGEELDFCSQAARASREAAIAPIAMRFIFVLIEFTPDGWRNGPQTRPKTRAKSTIKAGRAGNARSLRKMPGATSRTARHGITGK
ncbi:hypothetical protein CBF45_06225 [Bordetella sp. J329]|nr:hypothetical protein CBF45_06225 [Bordetella sp. J329]